MITATATTLELASWKLENTEIDAFCEGDEVFFQITGNHPTVTELALQNIQGWVHSKDVFWNTDLRTFYQLFQPIVLNNTELILSLIDREIVVGGRNLIRMVVSIEDKRPHLRIQSEGIIHSIPVENVTGLAHEIFQQIEGKVTQNVIERISRLADFGIVSIDLGQKKVEFGGMPIYFLHWSTYKITHLNVELSNTIDQIVQTILSNGYSHKESFYLLHKKHLQSNQKLPLYNGKRTLKEYGIGYGSLLCLKPRKFQISARSLSANKIINLKVSTEMSIFKLKQKIQKKVGTSWNHNYWNHHYLVFAGRILGQDEQAVIECNIQKGSTLLSNLRFCGGGTQPTSFANLHMENQTNISFNKNAPAWRIVAPGLNLKGICKTMGCQAKDQNVWIQKGFGCFSINKLANEFLDWDIPKELRECVCPMCKESVFVENCGFVNCIFSINGCSASKGKIEYADQEASDDTLLTFSESTNSHLLSQYFFLKITTTPKPIRTKESSIFDYYVENLNLF